MVNGGVIGKGGVEGAGRAKVVKGAGSVASIGLWGEIDKMHPNGCARSCRMPDRSCGLRPFRWAETKLRRRLRRDMMKRGRLFRCEGEGGDEDAGAHTPPIVEEVAYDYLQLLELGG